MHSLSSTLEDIIIVRDLSVTAGQRSHRYARLLRNAKVHLRDASYQSVSLHSMMHCSDGGCLPPHGESAPSRSIERQ